MTLIARPCMGCEQNDDHPKHVTVLSDDTTVAWHMDCHRLATGCEPCTWQLAEAGDKKGDDLRAHLESLAARSV